MCSPKQIQNDSEKLVKLVFSKERLCPVPLCDIPEVRVPSQSLQVISGIHT